VPKLLIVTKIREEIFKMEYLATKRRSSFDIGESDAILKRRRSISGTTAEIERLQKKESSDNGADQSITLPSFSNAFPEMPSTISSVERSQPQQVSNTWPQNLPTSIKSSTSEYQISQKERISPNPKPVIDESTINFGKHEIPEKNSYANTFGNFNTKSSPQIVLKPTTQSIPISVPSTSPKVHFKLPLPELKKNYYNPDYKVQAYPFKDILLLL